jgi:hypothetical protein
MHTARDCYVRLVVVINVMVQKLSAVVIITRAHKLPDMMSGKPGRRKSSI